MFRKKKTDRVALVKKNVKSTVGFYWRRNKAIGEMMGLRRPFSVRWAINKNKTGKSGRLLLYGACLLRIQRKQNAGVKAVSLAKNVQRKKDDALFTARNFRSGTQLRRKSARCTDSYAKANSPKKFKKITKRLLNSGSNFQCKYNSLLRFVLILLCSSPSDAYNNIRFTFRPRFAPFCGPLRQTCPSRSNPR